MSIMPDDRTGPLKSIKWYKTLSTGRGRLEAGAFLLEGSRAIDQVINGHPDALIEILSIAELPASYRRFNVRTINAKQLDSICSTKTPQGIVAVVRLPRDMYSDHLPEETGGKILLLEDIQDPGNVGTLLRTAAAFDFSGVILSGKCADPTSPKCVQSSAGTLLSLWIRRTSHYMDMVKDLKEAGHFIVATDLKGEEHPGVLQRQPRLLLSLGNEAAGLSQEMLHISDYRLRIAVDREKAESLNVSACGAICMYLSSLPVCD